MNWKQNKVIFNYIINQNYLIKKDIETTDILFIKWDQFEMKCKYFLAFTVDNKNNIFWSCDNSYIDQKTKYLSFQVKNNIGEKNLFSVETLNEIKKIIQSDFSVIYEKDQINFAWCLIGSYKNYKQFYVITDIIYF